MDKANGLCVFFLLGLASACQHDPSISISPLDLEGLSGSCVLIPCHFTVKEGETFHGLDSRAVWIKTKSQFESENSQLVVFNSSRTYTNYPMKIIGDINKRNCTTVFNDLKTEYTEIYFFRVEDGDFKATASCQYISITVRDSAWSPSIEVSGDQTETEVVTITCSAVTPCPDARPTLTLDLHQGTDSRLVSNPDGTFNTTITYQLPLTSSHDGYNVTCSAEYPTNDGKSAKTAQTTITLNVTPKEDNLAKWLPVVCVVLVALFGGIVYIWRVKFRRTKLLPVQVQTIEETDRQEQAQKEDGLHYGDITFNEPRSKPVVRAQDETVYSQIKVSNSNDRKATEMTDIYAQVKK